MMNILCIFSKHPRHITSDLALAFVEKGYKVYVIVPIEKKYGEKTSLIHENGFELVKVRSGNLFDNVNKYQKFISTLFLPRMFDKAIKSFWANHKFDLIITHTPNIVDHKLIRKLKKNYCCPALLLLWDIFPQNAIDLQLMRKGLFYRFLKNKERMMLNEFDYINCMSEGNKNYMSMHYNYLPKSKLMVNYNAERISTPIKIDRVGLRAEYGYNKDDNICVFGGNIGKPQAPHNIALLAKKLSKIKFLFIVRGTEHSHLKYLTRKLVNVKLLPYMDKNIYEKLVAMCDIGLISLDERFTVPNFPSKVIAYLKHGLPVFAMLDECSAKDLGCFLNKYNIGKYILAKEIESANTVLEKLIANEKEMMDMKKNCHLFYRENLNINSLAKNILSRIRNNLSSKN